MTLTVYGLKNCDTCKKALKALEGSGVAHRFVDIREEADRVAKVPAWLEAVGEGALVNRRSTTWRNLSEADKSVASEDPAGLLIANPTLIKRPVIEQGAVIHVGWTPAVEAALLPEAK